MTLIHSNMNNRQKLNQVKEFARARQWQEAKALIDTLPSTPEIYRLKNKIEKQLYIATGEIPIVGDVQLVDKEPVPETATAPQAYQPAEPRRTRIPQYGGIAMIALLAYVIGGIIAIAGIINAFSNDNFSMILIGVALIVSGEVLRVYRDIARNTARTSYLLEQVLKQD